MSHAGAPRRLALVLEQEAATGGAMTRLANVARDLGRDTILARAWEVLLDDALCLRPTAGHPLAAEAALRAEPPLAWLEARAGLRLPVREDLAPAPPWSKAMRARADALFASLDAFALAGVAAGAQASGSCVVALMLAAGAIEAEAACAAAFWEERGQLRLWGEDAPARQALAAREAALLEAARFCDLADSTKDAPKGCQ